MSIIDILILLFLAFGALVGFKQGFTRSIVDCVGYIIIIVIAFILKNPVSEILMSFMPFFDFFGLIKGLTVFNIVLYEGIAFLLVFSILMIVLRVLMLTTSIFEKILAFTIVLGIPSKILGAVVGVIKNFVIVFMVLYIINYVGITVGGLSDSKLREPILTKTPLLSSLAGETLNVTKEFATIKDKYQTIDNNNQFNLETLDLFLKYDVVTPKTAQKLIDNGKLKITGAESVISKYEEGE